MVGGFQSGLALDDGSGADFISYLTGFGVKWWVAVRTNARTNPKKLLSHNLTFPKKTTA
jgi:hypothetical protein